MSGLTKRHFEAIATILANAISKQTRGTPERKVLVDIAYDFCNYCGTQNGEFSPSRFADYVDLHILREEQAKKDSDEEEK
tara:strand:- start:1012 stop:1251 length:240 start_codon:yes stop_codon:yes gene_type:complete